MAHRVILHADMDAFFASVEQHDFPEYRGKPLIVGGTGRRGVVSAASYEARQFGVRSAMPGGEAQRRCPQGIFVRPRMSRYQQVSDQVFAIMRTITPLVEGLSVDEAFLDITGSIRHYGSAANVGHALRDSVKTATGLDISIGIAPSKFVAKIASDLEKPRGFVLVREADVQAFLAPLPVSRMWGIGRKTLPTLEAAGIHTFADLRLAPAGKLEALLGRQAERFRQLACGVDQRPVVVVHDDKSISHETTFHDDLADRALLAKVLLDQVDRVAAQLRHKQLSAGNIQLKLREPDFTTHTRSRRLRPASNESRALFTHARQLLDEWFSEHPGAALRLLGVACSQFESASQLGLFAEQKGQSDSRLDAVIDSVRQRFGNTAVQRGRLLKDED